MKKKGGKEEGGEGRGRRGREGEGGRARLVLGLGGVVVLALLVVLVDVVQEQVRVLQARVLRLLGEEVARIVLLGHQGRLLATTGG